MLPSPVDRSEHDMLPWEKNCHALLDLLDYHKIVNTEEKDGGSRNLDPVSSPEQVITRNGFFQQPGY